MITKESIENLSQRLNIVDIIENYIEVKKQGSSFVCICPFHADKNPSMHINPIKGFYHCFACKAGGDAFKFVMDYEKLSFADAVEKVASLSNFTLSYTKEKQENKKELKSILPSLNAYFKDNLKHHKEVLTYLYQRALNDKDIAKFELGFAGASEDSIRLLQNQKIPLEDAMSVGALKKDENNEFYASFIWRITFPIYDHKDLLVGFGGRTLNPNVPAKYVNSPQNILFDKSRIFYAFNIAKENIAKKKEIIVCEGYMDAIAFHKAGFNNAVAVLGTALTEHHLPLIRRYDAKVILCFDNDEAGLKAATRSAFLLSTNKIDGKVAILQGGKDPAELVAKNESTKLHNILDEGIELGEFYIRRLISTHSIISALDKQKALELCTFNITDEEKKKKLLEFKIEDNPMLGRLVFEKYHMFLGQNFFDICDLLYRENEAFNLENQDFLEFFYALGKISKHDDTHQFVFKNSNFKMLKILKDNSFNAGLEFSYRCSECKNVMPLFFYHCPVCYEFNTCKIIYEVKNNETH